MYKPYYDRPVKQTISDSGFRYGSVIQKEADPRLGRTRRQKPPVDIFGPSATNLPGIGTLRAHTLITEVGLVDMIKSNYLIRVIPLCQSCFIVDL